MYIHIPPSTPYTPMREEVVVGPWIGASMPRHDPPCHFDRPYHQKDIAVLHHEL